MLAARAVAASTEDPLSALAVGEMPDPSPPEGWKTVTVKAAALNHHDLWSLRGVGLAAERLPMILGCDAAGIDENGHEVLVQGAGGGVATALIVLAAAAGARVWVTSRAADKREQALALGAEQAFESGARLPERVDAVMETVGAATFGHSIRSLRPGGKLVISGATSGDAPPAELTRVFFLQLSVIGSTMGTRDELERLIRFCLERDIRPIRYATMPLAEARAGFEALVSGEVVGKIVFTT